MADVHYPADIQRTLSELNQLLDFAEEVSLKIDTGSEQIARQNMYLFGFVSILAVASGLFASLQRAIEPDSGEYVLSYIVIGVTTLFAMFAATSFVRYSKRNRGLDVERRILGDLTDMVSSLFKALEDDISSVDRALLKMRMRRISLAPIEDGNKGRFF